MIFWQLFSEDTSTYTYLLGCERTHEGVVVDPVLEEEERDLRAIDEAGLRVRWILDTHVHADHVTGASVLRERLGAPYALGSRSGVSCADRLLDHGEILEVGDLWLEVRHTPGHTSGCVSYLVGDRVLTGDALLIGKCGRTDFQEGDAGALYDSVTRQLFTLPAATRVYPAHDYSGRTSSTIGDERRDNVRLGGGRTRESFVALMDALDLAYPPHIDRALPANRRCGAPAGDE